MDRERAELVARKYITDQEKRDGVPLSLLEDQTVVRDFGWVFFYCVDASRSSEVIAGNGPLIVDKQTGQLHPCGSAYPADWYIDNYVRTGSVDGVMR